MSRDDDNRDAVKKAFGNHAADKDWNAKRKSGGCLMVLLPVAAAVATLAAALHRTS
jgi:hypothetical protein